MRILDPTHWSDAKQNSSQSEISSTSVDRVGSSNQPDVMDEEEISGTQQDIDDVQKERAEEPRPVGEVVGILQRIQRDYVACLAEDDEDMLRQSNFSRFLSILA